MSASVLGRSRRRAARSRPRRRRAPPGGARGSGEPLEIPGRLAGEVGVGVAPGTHQAEGGGGPLLVAELVLEEPDPVLDVRLEERRRARAQAAPVPGEGARQVACRSRPRATTNWARAAVPVRRPRLSDAPRRMAAVPSARRGNRPRPKASASVSGAAAAASARLVAAGTPTPWPRSAASICVPSARSGLTTSSSTQPR